MLSNGCSAATKRRLASRVSLSVAAIATRNRATGSSAGKTSPIRKRIRGGSCLVPGRPLAHSAIESVVEQIEQLVVEVDGVLGRTGVVVLRDRLARRDAIRGNTHSDETTAVQ